MTARSLSVLAGTKFYKPATESRSALFLCVSTHPDVGCFDLLSDDHEFVEFFVVKVGPQFSTSQFPVLTRSCDQRYRGQFQNWNIIGVSN